MPPILAALIGAALALVAVAFVLGALRARRGHREALEQERRPEVDATVEALLPHLPVGVVLVGPHDEILTSNEVAQRLGMVRGTRLGFPELLDQTRRCRADDEPFAGQIVRKPKPGEQRMELECRIGEVADGVLAVVGLDDTPIRRADAMRRDFLANVSHELKTPIGAIQVLAEAVEAGKEDPDAVARFTGRLQREASRLGALVCQIIDLSRLQASDPLLERQVVDLAHVVQEAVDNCRERAIGRRVNLIAPQPGTYPVIGERRQLVEAVTNLVSNAITYSDEGARVALALTTATDEDGVEVVELRVSDNGMGIPAEEQERIFERFYRVDYARSRSDGGSGLGLSIVRHIVLAHGGTISVWSAPGQGSTFTVRLPAHTAAPHQEEQ